MTNKLSNSNKPAKRRAWTPKRRAEQAARLKARKPWKKSTGPVTEAGRETVARNAQTHGFRSRDMARLRAALKLQREYMKMEVFNALKRD